MKILWRQRAQGGEETDGKKTLTEAITHSDASKRALGSEQGRLLAFCDVLADAKLAETVDADRQRHATGHYREEKSKQGEKKGWFR